MRALFVATAILAGATSSAIADDVRHLDATGEFKAPVVLTDQEMDRIVAGAHIRNMLVRQGNANFNDAAFDALGGAGSTVRGPAPGAEVGTINGLFPAVPAVE